MYQVHLGKSDYETTDRIRVLLFTKFCKKLNMPHFGNKRENDLTIIVIIYLLIYLHFY